MSKQRIESLTATNVALQKAYDEKDERIAELEGALERIANDKGNDKWGAVDMRVIARAALGGEK